MKFLIDFFPVILFFVAYKLYGIYAATVVAIAASAAQVAWFRLRHKRTERMHLVTLGLLTVFGGLTLALRDPIFVMWKPTLVNWLFGAAFLGSQFIGERTLVERMMSQAVDVPQGIWRRLNLAWAGFFAFSGLVNLYVVYFWSGFFQAKQDLVAATGAPEVDLSQCASLYTGAVKTLCDTASASEAVWVNFKLFGMMGLTALFVIAQAFYIARHIRNDDEAGKGGQPDQPPPTTT
ncbi:septation protein A [Thiohalocapsa marina]|uniref:Inner membrane-spanning protein YciB n=1 Tax=Thiohalocapsa marina TaxID=424902 RepID=A0A5M8FJ19_9GAMM|nr:septation protein A [Thiohalocapsa marina]KAA6184667.1 septation protein A [Thiohalocapsa marina]